MLNIIKFLSKSKLAIVAILVLLVCQAYCDLALPSYTSDILNVGLQQGGISSSVPDTIRQTSLKQLESYMDKDEQQVLENSYSDANSEGIRSLLPDADTDKLDNILCLYESIAYQMDNISAPTSAVAAAKENLSELTDTYLSQIAVNYVAAEYQAQGLDMEEIRNDYLYSTGFKMLLMSFFMTVTAILTGLLAARVSAKIGKNLRETLYEKVMNFSNQEFEHFSTASLITRSTNDIQQIQMVIVLLLRMVAYAPILAVGGILKVIDTDTGMSWIIVLAVVILAACVGILIAIAMPAFKKMQTLVDNLNLVSREILTGIMPIRAFGREKFEEARFDKANTDLYSTQLFTNRVMTFMSPIMMFVMNGISVLIVWVGASGVDNGQIQIGDLTAFITYSMVIVMGFLMISAICIILPRAGVAADRIVEVIDMPVSIADKDNVKDGELKEVKGVIHFDNVSFTYPNAEEPALENISFTASPGKTTAIIGSTGCGKTTLVKLIPRFFDVTKGSISLDGIDIRDLSQRKLREQLGYVPQKGLLFSGTIASNIKYSSNDISDEDMALAADIAQATEFIDSKEEKYESHIAQDGSNVSGGQKQRLSIARAIARHPKIYIFDDSFSALDYRTDKALRDALQKHTGNSTVIIVAQRISTILHADQIIVLDDGKIVGCGTHQELLRTCSTYLEIARSQLSESELKFSNGGEC